VVALPVRRRFWSFFKPTCQCHDSRLSLFSDVDVVTWQRFFFYGGVLPAISLFCWSEMSYKKGKFV
jgi:hypothetical protein